MRQFFVFPSMGLRTQFAKPAGAMGWVAGQLMARRNRDQSLWVFSLLDLKPSEHVLEIGFGPGMDIERASHAAAFVAGVDHSELMLRQASKRNREAIQQGRVELKLGSAGQLPYPDGRFDSLFAINSAQFWKDTVKTLTEAGRVLKPGGRIVLAVQPRSKGATTETARQAGIGLAKALTAAGFQDVHSELNEMRPVAMVCVLARR